MKAKRPNLLKNTRCYLPGSMQYAKDGRTWRTKIKEKLEDRNITFFDPYIKPFDHDASENENSRSEMLHWMDTEQYDLVTQRMKKVRGYDLRLVDLSDWFICNISPTVASWGTAEELSVIVREQKPVFIVMDSPKGKRDVPLWILSMIPHKYIYSTLDEAINTVKAIDDGVVKMSSDKWRLLTPDLR
jgi:nucleoside 2-deoxyribosyltransferase